MSVIGSGVAAARGTRWMFRCAAHLRPRGAEVAAHGIAGRRLRSPRRGAPCRARAGTRRRPFGRGRWRALRFARGLPCRMRLCRRRRLCYAPGFGALKNIMPTVAATPKAASMRKPAM